VTYKSELTAAMTMLAQNSKTLFLGQSVVYGGQAMFDTFASVPMAQRIEMPVCEDLQMGFSTGLAIEGFIPVSIYPRINFLLLAMSQLVTHLDKWPALTGQNPKVIIRTAVGSDSPIYHGPQHTGNYVEAIRAMLTTVNIFDLWHEREIVPAYDLALNAPGSFLMVEHRSVYDA
jgi:pyruvate/2-oxoglutarate/acetoin dehydrogenase E1 component